MPPSLSKRIWDNLPDADDLFAYDTVKEVRVLDRRLGLVYYSVFNLVLFYILVYVFAIEKRYQDREKAVGWVVSTASNPPIPDKEPHDLFDISASEQDAIFLPTRILRTTGQENKNTKTDADFCASPLHKCTTAADCEIENAAQQKVTSALPAHA
ncbi:unnamed protein product [Amoebophrya sp. A25]|nr:unnamed protein product [Amoebophrya sp. A25]|eukprot:GSA25T00020275001.1